MLRFRYLCMTLLLAGPAEALTGAQSPTYAEVMMHRSAVENGTASMQHVQQLEVAPGATVRFASGGYHLMLMQRQQSGAKHGAGAFAG